MSRKRLIQEFKIEAVRQITERGFAVRDVGDPLRACVRMDKSYTLQVGSLG